MENKVWITQGQSYGHLSKLCSWQSSCSEWFVGSVQCSLQQMETQKTSSAVSCSSDMEELLALLEIRCAKFPLCGFGFFNWCRGAAEEGEMLG